jgi:hypothetical protein
LLHFWLCIEHGQCDENTGAAPASLRSGSTRLREYFGGSNLAVYRIGKPSKVILQCPQCNVLQHRNGINSNFFSFLFPLDIDLKKKPYAPT